MRQFGKLLANVLYGKLTENVMKQRDIRLTKNPKVANKIVKSPFLKNFNIFQNLIGFELIKNKVIMNKPRFVGFSILEFSS